MCGRYDFSDPDKLRERYELENELKGLKPRYNVAPGQVMPVITGNDKNHGQLMRWGLVPSWAKGSNIGYKMINARAERIHTKPSYGRLLRNHRCLVPATGFYEWKKGEKNKIPFYIKLKNDAIFSFAGLFDIWNDKQ